MSYLTNYQNDIFISYSHIDNEPEYDSKIAWIDEFKERLHAVLRKKISKSVNIWHDSKIRKSEIFDKSIEQALDSTGFFLAILSPNYCQSLYCQNELEYFFEKAKCDRFGLNIRNNHRIVPIWIYNIRNTNLPEKFVKCLTGRSGFQFFQLDKLDTNDILGTPFQPGTEKFENEFRSLANTLIEVITDFEHVLKNPEETLNIPKERDQLQQFKIFFADVPNTLLRIKKECGDMLRQKNICLIDQVPPPRPFKEHEAAVIDNLKVANLSLHLLDDLPGTPIDGTENHYYPYRQAELGMDYAQSAIFCLPDPLNIDLIEEPNYKQFIGELTGKSLKNSAHRVLRSIKGELKQKIVADILDLIQKQQTEIIPDRTTSLLIDVNPNEIEFELACELAANLKEKGINAFIIPALGQNGSSTRKYFEWKLRQTSRLLFFLGQVNLAWVIGRIAHVQKCLATSNFNLALCGIYVAQAKQDLEELYAIIDYIKSINSFELKLFFNPDNLLNYLN